MLGFAHGRLIDCDKAEVEFGYVPLAEVGAEFLFQVVVGRAEKAAIIVTSNLPFSEWTQVIPNARLFKALIDRITDRAHIIETSAESDRFRRTLEKRKSGTSLANTTSAPPPATSKKGNCNRLVLSSHER
jgi:hypothetical protein